MEPKKTSLSSKNSALENRDLQNQSFADSKSDTNLPALESVSGRVSEVVGNIPSEIPSSSAKPAASQRAVTMSLEERKAKLLESLPMDQKIAENKMRAEITSALDDKISRLQREASSTSSPFHLSRIVQEIRQLKKILLDLASAAFEYLKTLWLRLVHGLSI